MNTYQKGATLLFRLVAVGFMVVGGMLTGLELLSRRAQWQPELDRPKVAFYLLLLVAGLVLFSFSSKLAARLTGGFDE
jgi:hypothetical protein